MAALLLLFLKRILLILHRIFPDHANCKAAIMCLSFNVRMFQSKWLTVWPLFDRALWTEVHSSPGRFVFFKGKVPIAAVSQLFGKSYLLAPVFGLQYAGL